MSVALNKKKSKKEELILGTSKKLFFRDGFKKVTVEQIVSDAKVSKRTFYKYFADKPSIIEAVCLSILEQSKRSLSDLAEKVKLCPITKADFLRVFELDEYDFYFQSESLPEYAKEISKEYPELIENLSRYMNDNILPKYADLINEAKLNGIVRNDIDTELFIQYSLNMRVAIKNTIVNNPEIVKRIGTKKLTQQCLECYLNGVIIN